MVRIITFNTLGYSHDRPVDSGRRAERIIRSIEQEGVDVAMLQEIKTIYRMPDGNKHSSAEWLRTSDLYSQNMRLVYADQQATRTECVGILSRHCIVSEDFGPLPRDIVGRAYLLVYVRVQADSDQYFYAMTFHLSAPPIGRVIEHYHSDYANQERFRASQLEKLSCIISSLDQRYPVFVGADFNTETDNPVYSSWRDGLGMQEIYPDTPHHRRKTFATHPSPSYQCGLEYRFDHLLYRDGTLMKVRVAAQGPIFDKPVAEPDRLFYGYLSDHVGIYADVELYHE